MQWCHLKIQLAQSTNAWWEVLRIILLSLLGGTNWAICGSMFGEEKLYVYAFIVSESIYLILMLFLILWQLIILVPQSAANGPQDESVAQDKVEATCENDAASNHSNGNTSCIQRNEENIDKGSDAQVSISSFMFEPEKTVVSVWSSIKYRFLYWSVLWMITW